MTSQFMLDCTFALFIFSKITNSINAIKSFSEDVNKMLMIKNLYNH